jgi:hypothetical protein
MLRKATLSRNRSRSPRGAGQRNNALGQLPDELDRLLGVPIKDPFWHSPGPVTRMPPAGGEAVPRTHHRADSSDASFSRTCSRPRLESSDPMPSDSTTCMETPGNGARTGTARYYTTPHPPQTTLLAQLLEVSVSFAGVPSASGRSSRDRLTGTGTRLATGASTSGSVLPGLIDHLAV